MDANSFVFEDMFVSQEILLNLRFKLTTWPKTKKDAKR